MRILRGYQYLPKKAKNAVVAVGNFDGVHLGHQKIMKTAKKISDSINAPLLVLTFEPHPRLFFDPGLSSFLLTTLKTKETYLENLDVDYLCPLNFDRKFSNIEANYFVKKILVDSLKVRCVVTGSNFFFGKGRRGGKDLLISLSRKYNFTYTCVDRLRDKHGTVYSSSAIRDFLKQGQIIRANKSLGRSWEIDGKVLIGDKRGKKLGYPTANLKLGKYAKLAFGVYVIKGKIYSESRDKWINGIANIGSRPTFSGNDIFLEVHFFNFRKNLYSKFLSIRFLDFLRKEKKFKNTNALINQIARDIKKAKRILGRT